MDMTIRYTITRSMGDPNPGYTSLLQAPAFATTAKAARKRNKSTINFSNKSESLLRDWQKLPRMTVFQVIPAGYWVKFSTSKDHVSDEPHRLRYCLCERMPAEVAASPVLLSGHGTTGWYQALNCHVISLLALTAAWCVYETGE